MKDGQTLGYLVLINTCDRTLEQALLVAQQNLGDIGVGLKVERVEPGVFGERRSARDFDALSRIWNPVYDPDQRALFKTGNFSGYSNAEIDPLVDKAMRFPDRALRRPVYVKNQQILSEDVAHLFLYTGNEPHAIASSVTGLEDHPVSVFWNLLPAERSRRDRVVPHWRRSFARPVPAASSLHPPARPIS